MTTPKRGRPPMSKETCSNGHPWDEDNTGWRWNDYAVRVRYCKTCIREENRRQREKRRARAQGVEIGHAQGGTE